MIKALILDRDGTLIEHVPYLSDPSLVRLLPGVKKGLRDATKAGIKLFLHTNQSGVGRGFFSMEQVHACNEAMIAQLELGHSPFERICVAPEAPDDVAVYRKPSPKFAEEVIVSYHLESSELCYIGDRAIDLQAAMAARTNAIGLTTGGLNLQVELSDLGIDGLFPVFSDFEMAIHHIVKGQL